MSEPKLEELWKRITDEIVGARTAFHRALEPGAPNTFTWNGQDCWVDRTRWLIVPLHSATYAGIANQSAIPDTDEGRNLLELFGGADRQESTIGFIKFLTRFVREQSPVSSSLAGYHFLNLAGVQPLVNPAFEPLLWIDLASDLGKSFQRNNIFAELAPLAFDMTRWPESRDAATDIRHAQAELVSQTVQTPSVEALLKLTDAEWTERCRRLHDERHAVVAGRIANKVFEYAL